MIVHVVLYKPRPDLPSADRTAFLAALQHALKTIPSVRGVRVGRRVTIGAEYERRAPDAADFLAAIEFDDAEGLRQYLQHPAHQELGVRFNRSIAAGFVYDFEIVDVDALSSLPPFEL